MSAKIIPLPTKPAPSRMPLPGLPRWACIACGGEDFRLYESGDVHCISCHARMSNVTVQPR